jgi:small subunit ribosomal protein S18
MGIGGKRSNSRRRKVCRFCANPDLALTYKEPLILNQFLTERGKIVPSRISGSCAFHQRLLAVEIKRARNVALLPFTNDLAG